jgi:hypothetical protein
MKSLVFLLALTTTASVFAQTHKVSFTHFGNRGGNQSYYACSFVESQAYKYLELLGATDVRVRCSGGIQSGGWHPQPVSVTATFQLPALTGVEESLEIRGDHWNPACGLNTQMLREFIKVMPHVEVVRKSDSCAFHNSNFFYQLNITR